MLVGFFFLHSYFDCLKMFWMDGCSCGFYLASLETARFLLFAGCSISKIAEEAFSISYYLFKMKKPQNTVLSNTKRSHLRLRE